MTPATRTDLVLVFHNHQPVGNFDAVFRAAHDRCYRPLLDVIIRHPEVRVAMHHSGSLFEWLAREEPSYLPDLRALVERQQVEVVGGGFYEPMLALLTDDDVRGQIDMMNAFVDRHLGTLPRGLWLAERVWDPDLPRALAPAGVQYTLLDDSHLMGAGLLPDESLDVSGFYVTEKAGASMAIFPISRRLRYAIPFRPVAEVVEGIASMGARLAAAGRSTVLTYGDDGEKLGLWPGTEQLVAEGWLESFFKTLEDNADRIHTTTPTTVLVRHPSSGRVYLPTSAYEEMDAWVLPPEACNQLQRVRAAARNAPPDSALAQALPFLRGGVWSNFLARYPEANRMHKRMLHVSSKLREGFVAQRAGALYGDADEAADRLATAQRALYAGQCACAYWHGWYGGIYQPHLRHAVIEHLLQAETLLDQVLLGDQPIAQAERLDFDGDLADEAVLGNAAIRIIARPTEGGALSAVDDRARAYPLLNVMARRREGYHDQLGADAHLVFDDAARLGFLDRFYRSDADPVSVRDRTSPDIGGLATSVYSLVEVGACDDLDGSVEAVLRGDGWVRDRHGDARVRLVKRYLVARDAAAVQVVYTLTHEQGAPLTCLFAPEVNLSLLSDDDPERFVLAGRQRLAPGLSGTVEGIGEICVVDGHLDLAAVLSADEAVRFWHYPVITRNRSDVGFGEVFQGVALHPVFELCMKPGEVRDLVLMLGITSARELLDEAPPA
ncbi:MAG: alpha-amylase/4-alpha-glucanotransferase domain-containing protein [Pseudomonadota bacterium]